MSTHAKPKSTIAFNGRFVGARLIPLLLVVLAAGRPAYASGEEFFQQARRAYLAGDHRGAAADAAKYIRRTYPSDSASYNEHEASIRTYTKQEIPVASGKIFRNEAERLNYVWEQIPASDKNPVPYSCWGGYRAAPPGYRKMFDLAKACWVVIPITH
jgi:hypothetical protein